jgi:hypothetical protein
MDGAGSMHEREFRNAAKFEPNKLNINLSIDGKAILK